MLVGGCLCGAVRYACDAPPFHETVCHCASCRRAVGAAEVAWFSVPRAALRFTAGVPTRYASSPGVVRSFCGHCGTSLAYEAQAHPDEIDLTIASLDDPEAVAPKDHTQVAERLRWTVVPDGLPAYPRGRPGR
ncbi:GFA family protein [Methylobacterium sp. JK268]